MFLYVLSLCAQRKYQRKGTPRSRPSGSFAHSGKSARNKLASLRQELLVFPIFPLSLTSFKGTPVLVLKFTAWEKTKMISGG
jgi:hypothetical protein